jgi:hypothetical protein
MNDNEVAKLVDKGRLLKEKMDAIEVELNKIKSTLKAEAKSRKVGHLLGVKRFCRVGPMTSTEVDVKEAFDFFEESNDRESFFSIVKVLVGKAKELMGESVLASMSESTTIPYSKVSFLANIPKKYLEEK